MIVLLLALSAWALSSYDELSLSVSGGTTVEGQYLRAASPTAVNVLVAGEIVTVEVVLIEKVTVGGVPEDPAQFRNEIAAAWETRLRPDLGPRPLPGVAFASSILYSGTGQALLKQGPEFRGYAALQAVFLGAEAFALYKKDVGVVVLVGAVDVAFRGLSAVGAYRAARVRRGHHVEPDVETKNGGA